MTENKSRLSKTPIMILGAMFCCLLWGSAFPCIKIGYQLFQISSDDVASRVFFAGCRFAIAGAMVILVACLTQKRFVKPQTPGRIAVLSAFQTVIQYLFFYSGLAHTTGVKSSIITGAGTFLTIFICALGFHQEKLSVRKVVGSALGFVGIILVNLNGLDFEFSFSGEGFILIAALSSALASGYIKKFSKDSDVVMLSGYQFFFGGIFMAIVGKFLGGQMREIHFGGILLLLYMGFISAAAYTIWGLLLKYNDVSKVSACKFMNPIFGVLLSFLLLGESSQFGWQLAVALIMVSVGVYIVNV